MFVASSPPSYPVGDTQIVGSDVNPDFRGYLEDGLVGVLSCIRLGVWDTIK